MEARTALSALLGRFPGPAPAFTAGDLAQVPSFIAYGWQAVPGAAHELTRPSGALRFRTGGLESRGYSPPGFSFRGGSWSRNSKPHRPEATRIGRLHTPRGTCVQSLVYPGG
jgi:hypothetical protein